MVENTLRNEKLSDDFTGKILDEAIKKAKEAQRSWSKAYFVELCQEALESAAKLGDFRAKIEIHTMLGEAETTWLGNPEKAYESYESALKIAQESKDKAETARVLKAMFIANCRHGEYDKMKQHALEAMKLFPEIGDKENEAFTQSALDLADTLPDVWKPGQAGGYVMAVFPLEVGDDGHKFLDPKSVRNYTWGCPSRCAALVHLLRPRRFLGSSLKVGSTWEDEFGQIEDGLSWGIEGDDKVIAKSVVESDNDTVVTPAGKFEKCLRVNTTITPIDDVVSPEFRTRSYCGTKMMWFAPGVGLVKLRHEGQTTVYLIGYSHSNDEGYFPVSQGRMWHYRWMKAGISMFEDICRVTGNDSDIFYISSATWGKDVARNESPKYSEDMLKYEIESGDLAGEAATLEEIVQDCEREKGLKGYERLVEIYKVLGDEWKLFNASWQLEELKRGLTPQEYIQWEEGKLQIARKLSNWSEEAGALLSMSQKYLDSGDSDRSIELMEQGADILAKHGDIDFAAFHVAGADYIREKQQQPVTPQCSYVYGINSITKKAGKLCSEVSSRFLPEDKFPPGDYEGTPMTDFFFNVPLGLESLSDSIGDFTNSGSNTDEPWGTESMRTKSVLVSKDEKVSVYAGDFSGCLLVETQILTSDEMEEDSERSFYRGYWAGTGQTWFAPGIGIVRVVYKHRNGYVTDIQLMKYEITEPTDDCFPLALNSRWRYRWDDQKSGVNFEDSLRVASHKNGKWNISFVTRATTQA